jgi:hypothetical protein
MRSNAPMVFLIVGSALLVAIVSLWVIGHFSPESLRLGLSYPRANASAPRPSPAAPPTPSLSPPQPPLVDLPIRLPASSRTPTTPAKTPKPTTPTTLSVANDPPPELIPPSQPIVGPSTSAPPVTTDPPSPTTDPPATTSDPPVTDRDPDTLPVNASGASVHLTSITLGVNADGTPNVTVQGIRPDGAATAATDTFVDWGDQSPSTTTSTTDNPVVAGGFTLSHSYSSDASYTIRWGYTSDRAHTWTHTIIASGAPVGPPQQALFDGGATGTLEKFGINDTAGSVWSAWTLDYGDGAWVSGDDTTRPTAEQLQHDYPQAGGHVAELTVVGPDGQLSTSTVNTP